MKSSSDSGRSSGDSRDGSGSDGGDEGPDNQGVLVIEDRHRGAEAETVEDSLTQDGFDVVKVDSLLQGLAVANRNIEVSCWPALRRTGWLTSTLPACGITRDLGGLWGRVGANQQGWPP